MAGLAFVDYGDDWASLPYVDRPHQRTHQHRTFLQYMARHVPPPEQYPNRPDVDIRDSAKAYLVEVEVPGVRSTSEISVKWTSSSSLIVEGSVDRSSWQELKHKTKQAVDANGKNTHDEPSHGLNGIPGDETLVIEERRIGPFRRLISFPSPIEAKDVTAKLEVGLLTLRIPKVRHITHEHDLNVRITI